MNSDKIQIQEKKIRAFQEDEDRLKSPQGKDKSISNEVTQQRNEKNSKVLVVNLNMEPKDIPEAIQEIRVQGSSDSVIPENNAEDTSIREKVIVSEKIERIGEDWYFERITIALYNLTNKINDPENNYWIKRFKYVWNLLCYLSLLCFYTMFLVQQRYNPEDPSFIVVIIMQTFCLALISTTVLDIYKYWIKGEKDRHYMYYATTAVWLIFLGVSIIILNQEIRRNNMLAWVMLAEEASINIILFLSALIWLALFPSIFAIFGFELAIRLITGKAECPTEKQEEFIYKYRLYKHDSKQFAEIPSCAICLENFNEKDKTLCVLDCKTNHVFHEKCIFEWLPKHKQCPICRNTAKFML